MPGSVWYHLHEMTEDVEAGEIPSTLVVPGAGEGGGCEWQQVCGDETSWNQMMMKVAQQCEHLNATKLFTLKWLMVDFILCGGCVFMCLVMSNSLILQGL